MGFSDIATIIGAAIGAMAAVGTWYGTQLWERRTTRLAADALDGAVQQEMDVEGAADLHLVARLGGVARQRAGRDQENPAETRQRRRDLVGQAGGKIRLGLGRADHL